MSVSDANNILSWLHGKDDIIRQIKSWNDGSKRCPFLDAGLKCIIYVVRPLICNIFGHVKEQQCPNGVLFDKWADEYNDVFIDNIANGFVTTKSIADFVISGSSLVVTKNR